jgi:cytochrome c oxidase subunit II
VFGHSVLNPMSPQALAISNLFVFLLIAAGANLLGLVGTLAITLPLYRHRKGRGDPPQTFGRVDMEIAWTSAPFIILAIVFAVTVYTMILSHPGDDPPPARAQSSDLVVVGHQWWWEFRYPNGLVTANEPHIPLHKRMLVSLKSDDVIHSFWVPQLNGKMDLVPGQTNHMWLQADKADTYFGNCVEFCGTGHAWMLLHVVAQPPAQFAAWERAQLRPAKPPTTPLALQGLGVYTAHTCYVCHNISGLVPLQHRGSSSVLVAPDLTHFASRMTLGAGRLANTPANVAAWLRNPDALKPGVHMPNLQLTPPEIKALTAFLETLK